MLDEKRIYNAFAKIQQAEAAIPQGVKAAGYKKKNSLNLVLAAASTALALTIGVMFYMISPITLGIAEGGNVAVDNGLRIEVFGVRFDFREYDIYQYFYENDLPYPERYAGVYIGLNQIMAYMSVQNIAGAGIPTVTCIQAEGISGATISILHTNREENKIYLRADMIGMTNNYPIENLIINTILQDGGQLQATMPLPEIFEAAELLPLPGLDYFFFRDYQVRSVDYVLKPQPQGTFPDLPYVNPEFQWISNIATVGEYLHLQQTIRMELNEHGLWPRRTMMFTSLSYNDSHKQSDINLGFFLDEYGNFIHENDLFTPVLPSVSYQLTEQVYNISEVENPNYLSINIFGTQIYQAHGSWPITINPYTSGIIEIAERFETQGVELYLLFLSPLGLHIWGTGQRYQATRDFLRSGIYIQTYDKKISLSSASHTIPSLRNNDWAFNHFLFAEYLIDMSQARYILLGDLQIPVFHRI